MHVYRFEDPTTHSGMYGNDGSLWAPIGAYYDAAGSASDEEEKDRRPTPRDDFPAEVLDGHEPEEFRFGFDSLEQAKHWLPSRIGRAAMRYSAHQVLAEYEVADEFVLKGGHQVMFYKGHEKFLRNLDPVSFKPAV